MNICYLNGKMLPMNGAVISVRDLGFLRGYGVFDVLPVVNGKPFLFTEHWARLERSAASLGLWLPVDAKEAEAIMLDLISRHAYPYMIVRTVLSGGPSEGGFLPEGQETFCVMIEETKPMPETLYEQGTKVITLEHFRHIPEAKTTNYIVPISHRQRKEHEGATEILYVDGDRVLEASTSNFFIVKNGEIFTAKKDVLGGITRELVLRFARELGIPAHNGGITRHDLAGCDEAFLTASNKAVLPIVTVDGLSVGSGAVGPVSKKLLLALREFMAKY